MLFEGARGREVVLVLPGDLTFLSEPAGEMWDRAADGAVCILFAEAAWETGLFECCMERQILYLRG